MRDSAQIGAGAQGGLTGESGFRVLGRGMRRLFVLSCCLVAIMGAPLFLWPTETERNFAWTIRPPITAAFMGAGYWGSFFVVLLALRERVWANARIGLPFAVAFAFLMLFATLAHLDRFHFGTAFSPAAQFMTWTWLAVYVVVPLLQTALIIGLYRSPGADPPIQTPMRPMYRAILGASGALLVLLGVALVVAPLAAAGAFWPWMLTPLTARAVGAWLVAWGVVTGQIALEGDRRRARPGYAGLAAFGVLALVAVARFADALRWQEPRAIAFTAAAAALAAIGVFGLLRQSRR